MDNGLVDFVDALNAPSRNRSAYDILAEYLEGQGFRYANVAFLDLTTKSPMGLHSNMDADWLTHYVETEYALHDPLMGLLQNMDGSVLLDADLCRELPTTRRDLSDRMFDEIHDVGYRSSIVSVTQSPSLGKTIGVNMISELPREELSRSMEQRQFQTTMALSLAQLPMLDDLSRGAQGGRWIGLSTPAPRLTPREREVLQWLAQGLRVDRIAERMNLSNPTVNFHINAAKKRLGADTREQAVAIALMHRLL